MSIQVLLSSSKQYVTEKPHEMFVGLGLIVTAAMGTSVSHAASTVYFFFFLAGLSVAPKWTSIWKKLSKSEKWFLWGFMAYAISGVLAYVNIQDVDEYIKLLERYLRFLVAVPMYLYMRQYKINILTHLYVGVIVAGPFLLYVAVMSYLDDPKHPASGDYHHIIFASVAMLNVGVVFALFIAQTTKTWKGIILYNGVLVVSMLSGLVAALLSQSRAAWLVLPAYLIVATIYSIKQAKIKFLIGIVSILLVLGASIWSFQGEMVSERIDKAVDEVTSYYENGHYKTSVGQRLAMWDIAIDVWKEHPFMGTGPGDFDEEVRDLQKNGQYVGMDVFAATHNIYFQAIVNAGTLGLLAMLLAIFILPIMAFMSLDEGRTYYLLPAIMVMVSFAVVGLSESWTMRLPIVSVYIIFIITMLASAVESEGRSRG